MITIYKNDDNIPEDINNILKYYDGWSHVIISKNTKENITLCDEIANCIYNKNTEGCVSNIFKDGDYICIIH